MQSAKMSKAPAAIIAIFCFFIDLIFHTRFCVRYIPLRVLSESNSFMCSFPVLNNIITNNCLDMCFEFGNKVKIFQPYT